MGGGRRRHSGRCGTSELRPLLGAAAGGPAPGLGGTALREARRPGQAPPRKLPASLVYHIARNTLFILSWQAYAVSGAKLGEAVYQEFRVLEGVPDAAFVLPAGRKVVRVANPEEYFRALKEIQAPKGEGTKR